MKWECGEDLAMKKAREYGIPEYMHEGMRLWVTRGIPPGDFLCAVIENDLRLACNYADSVNIKLIPEYVRWFYSVAPPACWGSSQAYIDWREATKDFR